MKKKNLFLSALLAGAMFMGNAQVAQAQFFPAANPDATAKSFATQANVINTGNSQLIVNGKQFRAMVYDGAGTTASDAPGIFVDYNGSTMFLRLGTPTGGAATDPDVAAYHYQADPNIIRMLVTYTKTNGVWIERYDYNISANMIYRTTMIPGITNTTYSNVDVNEVGEGVIVYEKNGEIYARTVDLTQQTPVLTGEFRVDYEAPGMDEWWRSKPDVAIKKNTSGPGSTVSFIFREEYTDYSSWLYGGVTVTQEDFNFVQNQPATLNTFGVAWYNGLDHTEPYYPRIAVMHAPFMNDKDFAAVVQDGNLIVSIASNNNAASYNWTYLNDNSQSPDLSKSYNEKPAIAFAGDIPIAVWSNSSPYSNETDVITKRLGSNGFPLGTYYSVVNQNTSGSQFAPSISGTYYDNEALYTFYDKNANTLLYKSSSSYNSNLRQANPNNGSVNEQAETQLAVYPNPATDNSLIEITLKEANQVKALELYNLTGQKVCTYDLGKLAIGSNRINLQNKQTKNLPKGVYLLRLTTDKGMKVVKVLN